MIKSSLNSTKAHPSFMIGELVVVDHKVIMVVSRAKNDDELGPTEFRGVILHSDSPTTWSQNIGIEGIFWKEDAQLYIGTVTLEND